MVVEIICGITGYRSMRFDGTQVEDLLQTVISSDCRLAFTTASEKKEHQLLGHKHSLQRWCTCFLGRLDVITSTCSGLSSLRCVSKSVKEAHKNNFYNN
jgi:hypothetical protein